MVIGVDFTGEKKKNQKMLQEATRKDGDRRQMYLWKAQWRSAATSSLTHKTRKYTQPTALGK